MPPRVDENRWVERPLISDRLKKAAQFGCRAALIGPPGAGKSFLAFRFFHYLTRVSPDIPKCYLVMEPHDEDGLTAELLRRLGGEVSADSRENRERLTAYWYRQPNGVLLLDNALEHRHVDYLLPPEKSGWFVLLTCQNRSILSDLFHDCIDVGAFLPEESGRLFERRLGRERFKEQAGDIEKLCDELGHMPIAVAAASGAMAKRKRSTAAEWLEQFHSEMAIFEAGQKYQSVDHDTAARDNLITVVLRMSLEDLNKEPAPVRGHAWRILGALSAFHSGSGGCVRELAAVVNKAEDAELYFNERDALEILDVLEERSLVNIVRSEKGERFLLHRLIARAVYEELGSRREVATSIAPEDVPATNTFLQSFCSVWTAYVTRHDNAEGHEGFLLEWDNILESRDLLLANDCSETWQ